MSHIIQYMPTLQVSGPVEMMMPNQENFSQPPNVSGPMKDSNPHEASLRESIRNQQVENALQVLAQEAGFSEETIATLRQAVETGRRMKEGMAMGHGVHQHMPPPMPPFLNGLSGPVRVAQRNVKPASSKRQQLTVEEAAEIYSLRPTNSLDVLRGSMAHCRTIAPRYGVTPKTIRDVWSGRTWAEATRHLWTPEEVVQRAKRDAARRTSPKKDGSDEDDEEGEQGDNINIEQAPPVPGAPSMQAAPIPMGDHHGKQGLDTKVMGGKEVLEAVPAPDSVTGVGHPIPDPVA
mmetsp:Transcript_48369/g.96855  ORF Transcript_48369/g.96855 Transcript_48369/m.96855 type:complete len:291 (+) Transcript_48369:79-951(+)